jgi:hypothetical protein
MPGERGVSVDDGDYARFLRELDVLTKAGLLEWQMVVLNMTSLGCVSISYVEPHTPRPRD